MNRKNKKNKHVPSRNDSTGSIVHNKCAPEDDIRIYKDDYCIAVNNYTEYEQETIDQKVRNNANNNTPEEIKLEIDHVDKDLGSSSLTCNLETKGHPEQALSEKNQKSIEALQLQKRAMECSKLSVDIQECNNLARSQTSTLEKAAADPEQPVLRSDVQQDVPPQREHTVRTAIRLEKHRELLENRRRFDEKYGSLERRRLPVDDLLKPMKSTLLSSFESQNKEDALHASVGFIRRMFLNPKSSLGTQLLIVFGSVSAFIIVFLFSFYEILAQGFTGHLESISQANFKEIVSDVEMKSARYLAESITPTLIPEDAVRILYESVRDRFAGYPNDGDDFVPFVDIDSQTNKYPVIGVAGKSLPLDWQIDANVNDDNHEEHVQGRWSWYETDPLVSTASPFYVMQGMCDPSVTDPTASTYWENCTDSNNDVSTGGIVNPSPTNYQIYQKATSLSPILKAIFESHQDFRSLGIFFSNSGTGSALSFPHLQLNTSGSYKSIGCEWMNEPNPYEPWRPIGTKEEIARCHSNSTEVSSRSYNVLERAWCMDQALNPSTVLVDGPYIDAWDGAFIISAGQGIYDRITKEFIGCSYVELYMDNLEDFLVKSKVTENSQASVASFSDGTTVASTVWDSSTANDTIKIYNLTVGVNFTSFEKLQSLVDYNKTWNATEVRNTYDSFTLSHDGFLVAISPIPPVPKSFDRSYKPLFFAIISAPEKDIFQVISYVSTSFENHSVQVRQLSLIVGAIGLGIVLLVIYLMSKALTAPLEYMNSAADDIINHFGNKCSATNETGIINTAPGYCCFPKTELDEVVKEFNRMVTTFDVTTVTKPSEDGRQDYSNGFTIQKDFHDLYESRKDIKFGYKVSKISNCQVHSTKFIHLGTNISATAEVRRKAKTSIVWDDMKGQGILTSRLFFWTAVLIGTPLLTTTLAISGVVMYNIGKEFHSGIATAEAFYLKVISNALYLRTHVVSSGTSRAVRDLYVLTRYASWLLFGGVERSDSFTQVQTGVEQCKTYADDFTECPFYEENYFCDCAWDDAYSTCRNYTFDTRDRQSLQFLCEASNKFSNGDRNFTSFPNESHSPESTVWWDDVTTLPGFEKGSLASGYETTYDRLRVIAASPAHQLVYNKDIEKEYTVSSGIAFEADGMFVGFGGCSNFPVEASNWSSTKANGASELRPELCPLGKYGYDPRCRDWYDNGKKLAEKHGIPVYVTPPYVYAYADARIGQSATSPLIDPQTKEHIGQVLIDLQSGPIIDSLLDKNTQLDDTGFPILITNTSGPDSVVGPEFSLFNESARPISELVMPHEHNCNETECTERRGRFDQILSSMKNGERGNTNFTRATTTGSDETVYIAYAPVFVRGYRPLDSSDFSRGVKVYDIMVYSLAWAQTEGLRLEPFEKIEKAYTRQIRKFSIFFLITIILSVLLAMYTMSVVTLSVIEPMLVLREIINSINRLDVMDEPPTLNASIGSREINSFSNTIQMLHNVVRCGNYAFLSGDLENAYTVMNDARRLFLRLHNKKAVAIISNNIGNLLFVVYRVMDETDKDKFCGMTKLDVITEGISFYYDAIQLGEDAYDEIQKTEGWSPNCLDFLQHLSNRYFNRGMLLLTVKDGHEQPGRLEALGYQDLDISIDLDMETASWKDGTSVLKKYDVALVRAKGHLTLQEMGYPDTWDVLDRLDNAFMMVTKEAKKDKNSSLFKTIAVIGRIQEIEAELIRYWLLRREVKLAAQIGIRMLVEDEYIFMEAKEAALEALSIYFHGRMENNIDKRANRRHATFKNTSADVIEDEEIHTSSLHTMKQFVVDSNAFSEMLNMLGNSSIGYMTMEGL